ncbi:MAG: TlyA family RNA methyltransferase [Candidatus Sumerlaeaceae bacterium]
MGQLKSSLKFRIAAVDKGASTKQRLDVLMVERGLSESREQARRLILAGKVIVSGSDNPKPGQQFPGDVELRVAEPEKFVSRGGHKLEAALENFKVDVLGKTCADIGASTGGFTDCFLQHGAARVYAVDVGASQMHVRVRNDARVTLLEHTNARELTARSFPDTVEIAAVDVSFISLTKIFPALLRAMPDRAECIALIKPQFEAQRAEVSKGKGVIRDPAVHRRIIKELCHEFPRIGWSVKGMMPSPLYGGSGNREFLVHLQAAKQPGPAAALTCDIDIDAVLRQASNRA